jgi:hypothetical protein
MLESSPPLTCAEKCGKSALAFALFKDNFHQLTIKVLFRALVTHITAAIWSLQKEAKEIEL